MNITFIRQDSESGKETLSVCEAGTLFDKLNTETKSGHIMMQILNYLQTKTRDRLAINKVAQFGRMLQKLSIPSRKSYRGTLYHLVRIE